MPITESKNLLVTSKVLYPKGMSEGRIKRSNRNGNEHFIFRAKRKRFNPEHPKTLIAPSRSVMPRFENGTYSYLSNNNLHELREQICRCNRHGRKDNRAKTPKCSFARECMKVPVRFYLLPASNHNARSQSPPK